MAGIQRVPRLPVSLVSAMAPGGGPSVWSLLGIQSCKHPSLLTPGGRVRPPCPHFCLLCAGRSLCSEN